MFIYSGVSPILPHKKGDVQVIPRTSWVISENPRAGAFPTGRAGRGTGSFRLSQVPLLEAKGHQHFGRSKTFLREIDQRKKLRNRILYTFSCGGRQLPCVGQFFGPSLLQRKLT